MTPAGQGRHCAACDKVVVDFTRMTDAEVVAWLQRQPSGCGRFRTEQLLPIARRPRTGWPIWPALLAGISSQLMNPTSAVGQSTVQVAPTQQLALPARAKRGAKPPTTPLVVHGTVVDSLQSPLSGVTVLLDGTYVGASTDSLGRFELVIPPNLHHNGLLLFSQIGYYQQKLAATLFLQADAIVVMQLDRVTMNDRTVVGGYHTPRPPWYTPHGLWWNIRGLWWGIRRSFQE